MLKHAPYVKRWASESPFAFPLLPASRRLAVARPAEVAAAAACETRLPVEDHRPTWRSGASRYAWCARCIAGTFRPF